VIKLDGSKGKLVDAVIKQSKTDKKDFTLPKLSKVVFVKY